MSGKSQKKCYKPNRKKVTNSRSTLIVRLLVFIIIIESCRWWQRLVSEVWEWEARERGAVSTMSVASISNGARRFRSVGRQRGRGRRGAGGVDADAGPRRARRVRARAPRGAARLARAPPLRAHLRRYVHKLHRALLCSRLLKYHLYKHFNASDPRHSLDLNRTELLLVLKIRSPDRPFFDIHLFCDYKSKRHITFSNNV